MGVIGLMLHMRYGLVYLCQLLPFLVRCDYAPRLKDFVLSLGGFVIVLFCFYFFEENFHFEETVHFETYGC